MDRIEHTQIAPRTFDIGPRNVSSEIASKSASCDREYPMAKKLSASTSLGERGRTASGVRPFSN